MTSTTTTSLSFRPWASAKQEETALKDVLARVNLERGHFRDITEASLQEEIAAQGGLDLSSSDDEEEEQEDDSVGQKPAANREELYAAKRAMMGHADAALQEVLMSLDFIALLESKYAPNQATVSMSQELKNRAPPGSIGVDMWDQKGIPLDTARQAQDSLLASKVRIEGLQQSADNLLAAATRLQENVHKETVFWDQILDISDKGWTVSRIPGAHLLGVHFGFNGCAPEFATRNQAALIESSEGTISLERGIGTQPKAVRVVIRCNSPSDREMRIRGSSRLPFAPADDEKTLETRIRHARDSVYDEELFHELVREARSLTSLGVKMKGSKIVQALDDSRRLEIELVSLNENNSLPIELPQTFNDLADATLLAARLLLGQKHRDIARGRKEVPIPMGEKKVDSAETLSILRSLTLLLNHNYEIGRLNGLLSSAVGVLRNMGISAEQQSARLRLETSREGTFTAESLILSVSRPLTSEGALRLVISNEVTLELKLRIETSVKNAGTEFVLNAQTGETVEGMEFTGAEDAMKEILASWLSRALKEIGGEEWQWNERNGTLRREPGADQHKLESVYFTVGNWADGVDLVAVVAGKETKYHSWNLQSTDEPLKDVWKRMLE